MPDLAPFVGPVGGALLGATIAMVASVITSILTFRHQRQLEERRFLEARRDARRQRLSSAYEAILECVLAMEHYAAQASMTPVSTEPELKSLYNVYIGALQKADIRINLEGRAQAVSRQLKECTSTFSVLVNLYAQGRNNPSPPTQAWIDEVGYALKLFTTSATQLRDVIHRSLESFDVEK